MRKILPFFIRLGAIGRKLMTDFKHAMLTILIVLGAIAAIIVLADDLRKYFILSFVGMGVVFLIRNLLRWSW